MNSISFINARAKGRGSNPSLFSGRHIWLVPNSSSNNRVDMRSSAELENDADLGSSGTKADTAVKGGGTQFNNVIANLTCQ